MQMGLSREVDSTIDVWFLRLNVADISYQLRQTLPCRAEVRGQHRTPLSCSAISGVPDHGACSQCTLRSISLCNGRMDLLVSLSLRDYWRPNRRQTPL
jgi:hypothetical protein